ncbi:MAG: response regulator transcription factor [Candidatus Hermodarchaeota archaeon]
MAKFFIVDDDEFLVRLIENFFRENGHSVVAKAFNGEEAVKIYKELVKNSETRPDIVLMDYRMPWKDGLTAAKEILAFNPNCTIIFLSEDLAIKNMVLEINCAFFEKPCSLHSLLKSIASHSTNFSFKKVLCPYCGSMPSLFKREQLCYNCNNRLE